MGVDTWARSCRPVDTERRGVAGCSCRSSPPSCSPVWPPVWPWTPHPDRRRPRASDSRDEKLLYFAADGMRQDIVAALRRERCRARRSGGCCARRPGVRQRAADPGAAEHRRRLVHARDRRVAGRARLDEQHLPRQRPAVRQSHRGLRPGRPPGRDDRPVGRARRARRSRRSSGPAAATRTSPGRRSTSATSSRAAAWPRTTSRRPTIAAFIASLRPAVRPSRRLRRPGALRRRPPRTRDRLDRRPALVQPGQGDAPARPRRRGRQVRPERLHLRRDERRQPSTTTACCSRRPRTATTPSATCAQGEWADVKVTIVGGRSTGKTGGMLVKVETLGRRPVARCACSTRRSTRAIATWPTWPGEPGFTGTSRTSSPRRSRRRQAADFAVLEAGIVSEETYVEQGLYWETAYHPLIKYMLDTYQPDLALVGYPVTDEFQHQFLGLVTPDAAQRRAQPGLRRRRGQRHARRPRRRSVRRSSARAYQGADADDAPGPVATCATTTDDVRRVRPRLRAAVPGDRRQQGAGRPRAAVPAADVELPPGDRRDDRQGEGLLGRRHGPDLPQPRRARPGRSAGSSRSPRPTRRHGGRDQGRLRGAERPERLDRRRRSRRAGR